MPENRDYAISRADPLVQPSISTPYTKTTARERSGSRYFEALESLRGLACFIVVIFHLPAWNERIFDIHIVRSGYLMVDFFFVLSGFVMCHTYASSLSTLRDLRRFILLRIGRLYPVHFTFLFVFLVIETAKYVAAMRFGIPFPNGRPFGVNNGEALMQNVFLVQALGFSGNAETFNYPSWSISTEFYTYGLFALALYFLGRRSLFLASVLAVVASDASLWTLNGEPVHWRWMLKCISGFFTGCLVYSAYRHAAKIRLHPVIQWLPLIALGLYLEVTDHAAHSDLLMAPLSAVLIFTIVQNPESATARILLARPLFWLGRISYSLYLAHASVIMLVTLLLKFLLHNPRVYEGSKSISAIHLSGFASAIVYTGTIATALCLGWLSFRYIENPGRIRSRMAVARLMEQEL